MRVYIGYDPRDNDAYKVLEQSIRENTSEEVECIPVWDAPLRHKKLYWRAYHVDEAGQYWDDRDGKPFSTMFSFARFAVPMLEDFGDDIVLFMDADMMIRGDIKDLFNLWDNKYAVMCVKHQQRPSEGTKMDGKIQQAYKRKNWSSVMLMKPSKCRELNKFKLNNWSGSDLHGMTWLDSDKIGSLPGTWNFLAGHDDPEGANPMNVHHTLGTPDMVGLDAVVTPWDAEWWDTLDRANKGILNAPKK
tara:strand:- start:1305 stop:2042 length:738 start_codon:yes stop_codon:yes gene_type:complete